jgi:hypothetical protein
MARADFTSQLKALGFEVAELGDGRVSFSYTVETGRFAGTAIRLGFVAPEDFPASPPTGPHVSPRLLPINPPSGPHPTHGVHESAQFGADWQYWSRPMHHWVNTERNVKAVMAHVRHLFDTQ